MANNKSGFKTLLNSNYHGNREYQLEKLCDNNAVLRVNGKALAHTMNKTKDFYEGYMHGFERAIAIMKEGKPEEFGIQ